MPETGLRPLLMGIVNVTPDSFSDGGRHDDAPRAVAHGLRLLDEGADWLDVGGESTRPGAHDVDEGLELRRVVPVVEALVRARPGVVVCVDTRKASVAEAALRVGARVVNDVSALGDPLMAAVVASSGAELVLMHHRGDPRTMQQDTRYGDLLSDVEAFLKDRLDRALAAGIPRSRLLVDPGVGFGKNPADNPALIAATPRWKALGVRVLIGASRKGFIGQLTGVTVPAERVAGSIGAALASARWGADVLRIHDVLATRQALDVYVACGGGPGR